jgi:hypothetical protein
MSVEMSWETIYCHGHGLCYSSCRNWLWLGSDTDGDEGVGGRHAIIIRPYLTGGERRQSTSTWAESSSERISYRRHSVGGTGNAVFDGPMWERH